MTPAVLEALATDPRLPAPGGKAAAQQPRIPFSTVFDAAREAASTSEASPEGAAVDRAAEPRPEARHGGQATRPAAQPAEASHGRAAEDAARRPGGEKKAATTQPDQRPAMSRGKARPDGAANDAAAGPARGRALKPQAGQVGQAGQAAPADAGIRTALAARAPERAASRAKAADPGRPAEAAEAAEASRQGAAAPKQRQEAEARARRLREPRADAHAAAAAAAGVAAAGRPAASRSSGEPENAKSAGGPRRTEPSEPRIVVIDLRKAAPPRPRENAGEPPEPVVRGGREGDREARGVNVALFRAEKGGAPQAEPAPREAAGRFREVLQAELVRASTVILREDGAAGEMRLLLRPESLGAVRIHLRMVENRIEGQIVVDNRNVRQLFESALPALEQGLRDQGFGSASLEVSVGHRDSTDRREEPTAFARAEAVGSIESGTAPAGLPAALSLGDGLVDLVV